MKTRQGFVSNSSSSSFVITMTKEQEKEWKSKLNEYEKQVIYNEDSYMERSEDTFQNIEVVTFAGSEGNSCFYEDLGLDLLPEDEELTEEQFYDKYNCEIYAGEFWGTAQGKLPKDCLYTYYDM